MHNFLNMFYCLSLQVSGNYVLIIRKKYRTYVTPGICHSIYVTLCYAGRNEITPFIPYNHPYGVTNTRCHLGTVFSSDDGHIVARNMQRKSIKHIKKTVHQLVLFTRSKSSRNYEGRLISNAHSEISMK